MPIILEKNYHDPIENIDAEIRRRILNGDIESFIYVAPTKRKIRELQRDFLYCSPNGAAPAFSLYTLETLAAYLYSGICPPRRFIAGPVQAVLMNEAVHSCAKELQYFRLRGDAKRLPPGTLKRIIDVINTLKEKGVYRSTLLIELEHADVLERAKLFDILRIYDAYEHFLGDKFVDTAGLLKHINEEWDMAMTSALVRSIIGKVRTIVVTGFDEFSDPELTMLNNLSTVEGTAMLVSFDYHLGNDHVFGHLHENYKKFTEMGFRKITTRSETDKSFVNHIAAFLCNPQADIPKYSAREQVMLLAADDRLGEVELIAKVIKNLIRQQPDRDLSKICVSLFQPQLYTNLFREVFDRYNVPANITDRYYLDQSPLVVSVLSMLAIPLHDFRLTDLMRALASPYLNIEEDNRTIDAGNIYDVATLLKIPGGFARWMSRIDRRLDQVPREITEVEDEAEEVRLRHEAEMLLVAKSDLKTLRKLLHCFEEPMLPREFKGRVMKLLETLHVGECILTGACSLGDDEKLEKDTRAYQKFLSFLDDFFEILAFEGLEQTRERLPFYFDRLREGISQVRYNIRQKYGYGVSVTSLDETRGLQFDVMIIAGLVDGDFPPVYQPEVFFSSMRRARKEQYHLQEHRYLFYQGLTNYHEHLYLTYPKSDADGELVPSSFLTDLGNIVDLDDCRENIPREYTDIIYSKDDLLKQLGSGIRIEPDDITNPTGENFLDREIEELVDYMHTAAHVERGRITGASDPEYNGIIGSRLDDNEKIALERYKNYTYSVTQLEMYGKCPFQYFANKVLRLSAIKEVEEGITPLERGGVLHEMLFSYFIDRRDRKLPKLSDTTDVEFQQAINDLIALGARKLTDLQIPDIFWEIELEQFLGSHNRKGILREFLDVEREQRLEVEPAYFEAAFGSRVGSKKNTDPSLSHEKPIMVGNIQLRGKVDRIDRGKHFFRVIDYKTGRFPGRDEIDLGISLQLPLYLYAVERILGDHLHRVFRGAAGIHYLLNTPVEAKLGLGSGEHRDTVFVLKKKNRQMVETDEELRQIIDRAINYANKYVEEIAEGRFPVEPTMPERTCDYCNYNPICRIQTRRGLPAESSPDVKSEPI